MASYKITPITRATGEIPQQYQILETVHVDSLRDTTLEKILNLLSTSERKFILKSKTGWQYMTIQFMPNLAPTVNVSYTDVKEEAHASSPFRPRRKDSPKSSKKVSKKSGKVRKNKKSKKSRN